MNIDNLTFQISELNEHVGKLLTELREGKIKEDDWPALAIDLDHILDHVCLAWNTKDQSIEEMAALTQNEFEKAMHTVPHFGIVGLDRCMGAR